MPPGAKPNSSRTKENDDTDYTERYKTFLKKGFNEPVVPTKKEPKSPDALSSLTSDQLGDYMALYTAWREYTESLYNLEFAQNAILKEEFDNLVVTKKVLFGSTNKRLKDLQLEIDADKEVQVAKRKLLESNIMLDLLSNKIESYTNVYTTLSREVSRRSSLPMR